MGRLINIGGYCFTGSTPFVSVPKRDRVPSFYFSILSIMNEPCLSVKIPTAVFPYVSGSIKELQSEMLLFLATKCYQRSLLSIGKAAELAGMSKVHFEIYLSENKIPISHLNYSDVSGDLEKLKI